MLLPLRAQTTINVPGNAPTIQAAINAASDGDTVVVAPGTYLENIDFQGKAITVTSSGGAANTIIDGSQGDIVVRFVSGETRSSVLNGFTIKNAGASMYPNTSASTYFDGIKIGYTAACFDCISNPTITNNIVTDNHGYGIEIIFAGAYISGNTISNTSTQYDPQFDYGCDYDDGAGISVQGTANGLTQPSVIDHNTIKQNVGHCGGGGIRLYAAPAATVISNNIIANNQSLGDGGGVYVVNGSVSLHQNLIYNNVSGAAGGGVYGVGSGSVVTNNTIYGNTINPNHLILDDWIDGSQVALPGDVSQLAFFNNLILANDSYAAIACWPTYQYLSSAPPAVVNSDVRNTGGAAYGGWCTSPAGNTGNISADPKFKNASNGDFHLQPGSPAIDTGFNAAPGLLSTDLDGNARIQNATGISEPVVDMGAYEVTGAPESRSPSQTTLVAQPATVFYGQPVSLSATVTDSSSSPISPGTVNFMDDWSVILQSPLNNSGVATHSTSNLSVGPHSIVASFAGNPTYQPNISSPAQVIVNGFSTSTTIAFSPNQGHYGQPETLIATVTLGQGNPSGTGTPTGSVAFYSSANLGQSPLATVPLNGSGVAAYTTSSLPAGTPYVQAIYLPTGGFLGSSSQNVPVTIAAFPVASVAVSPSSAGISSIQPLTVTITVSGSFGNPTPSGTVTLTSGSYSSAATALQGGSAAINVPAGSLAGGNDALTVQYSGDSVYGAATGRGLVVVTAPFTVAGTAMAFAPGAPSGNQSVITVTPSGGFTGNVVLTAVITSSPAGASDLPTLSFGATANVSITTSTPGTATLTITTVAPVACSHAASIPHPLRWLPAILTLPCLLLFVLVGAGHSRRCFAIFLVLLGFSAATACGGGGGGASCTGGSSGTTAGNYLITVTGTSGSVTTTGSITLTIQ